MFFVPIKAQNPPKKAQKITGTLLVPKSHAFCAYKGTKSPPKKAQNEEDAGIDMFGGRSLPIIRIMSYYMNEGNITYYGGRYAAT